jgi:hypothetical protein
LRQAFAAPSACRRYPLVVRVSQSEGIGAL